MKKLSAVLIALAIIVSVLPPRAAQASFTDDADIVNAEAASMLTSMGIIQGFPDGKFHPTEDVTRAQMAKMIYYIVNGIRDKSDDGSASYSGSDLSDMNGHWAKGYVYFCYRKKIIAGYPDGTFKPDQNVTATEACKMLLVSLGYAADRYVGSAWGANTVSDAEKAGVTEGYAYSMGAPIDRDNAALFIYNTLFAEASDGSSLLQTVYGARKAAVTVTSNQYGTLDGSVCRDGQTRVRVSQGSSYETFLIDEATTLDQLGHSFAVYINAESSGEVRSIYGGFFPSGSDMTFIDTSRDLGFADIVGSGKAFTSVSAKASFYTNYFTSVSQDSFRQTISSHPDCKVIYISDDGDTVLDRAIAVTTQVRQVKGVDSVGVSAAGVSSVIPMENVIYTGSLAAGRFYGVTQVGEKYLFEDVREFTARLLSCSGGHVRTDSGDFEASSAQVFSSSGPEFIPVSLLSEKKYSELTVRFLTDPLGHIVVATLSDSIPDPVYAVLISSARLPSGEGDRLTMITGSSLSVKDYVSQAGGQAFTPYETGLYSFTAENTDGTVYGLKKTGTKVSDGVQVSVTGGEGSIGGISGARADENTVFFFWDGSVGDAPVAYKGIYEVPSAAVTTSSAVQVWYVQTPGRLEAVFITVSDPGTVSGYGYVYIFDTSAEVSSVKDPRGSTVTTYTYEGCSEGSRVRLKTTRSGVTPGLYVFSTSDGITSLTPLGSSNCIRTVVTEVYSGFLRLSDGDIPGSIHNWNGVPIYSVDVSSQSMTPASSVPAQSEAIIVFSRTGDNTADAVRIFTGVGLEFGA